MTIIFQDKINQRPTGSELLIVNEAHVIGVTGVAIVSPNTIRLIEVPLKELPSTVIIPGYLEALSSPGNLEFFVDYKNGRIEFNPAQDGNNVFVTYKGRGSIVDAEDINDLQDPLVAIAKDFGLLGSPDYGLADYVVTPNSISNVPTDHFTFPANVIVTGDFTVNGTTTTINTQTLNVEDIEPVPTPIIWSSST